MLAIGRALMLNPRLLLLDEPTEGLAPIIVDELLAALRELARAGLSMIIVEQKPKKILPFTDHAIVLDRGAIAHDAPSAELLADPSALDAHLTATKRRRGRLAPQPQTRPAIEMDPLGKEKALRPPGGQHAGDVGKQ